MSLVYSINTDIAAAARQILGSNISLRVDTFSSQSDKERSIIRRVEFADKPGIVYVATHKNAETIAADLNRAGVPADFYHGGLRPREREEIQNRFMSGQVPVIVATNAFGMGVDKPDIRFVYHADVADSLTLTTRRSAAPAATASLPKPSSSIAPRTSPRSSSKPAHPTSTALLSRPYITRSVGATIRFPAAISLELPAFRRASLPACCRSWKIAAPPSAGNRRGGGCQQTPAG